MSLRAAAIRADRVVTFVASFLSGGVLMAMSVLVAALVVARYGFSSPIFWGEEMARFLMFYLVMIGAAAALRHNQHPRLTMLLTALPSRGRVVLEVLIDTAVFGTLIVLFFHGLDLAQEEAIMKTPSLRISYFWIYLGYPLGAGLAILQLLGRRMNPAGTLTDEVDTDRSEAIE